MTANEEYRDDALRALREAVAEALERKRRLGQYAVIWRHGRPEFIGPNPPTGVDQHDTGSGESTIPHEVVSANVDGATPARAWREHLSLSQREVAERMGISQPAYAQMEAAAGKMRKATRERLAHALGIIPEQLDF